MEELGHGFDLLCSGRQYFGVGAVSGGPGAGHRIHEIASVNICSMYTQECGWVYAKAGCRRVHTRYGSDDRFNAGKEGVGPA